MAMHKRRASPRWERVLGEFANTLRAGGAAETTITTRIDHLRRMARMLGVEDPAAVDGERLIQWVGSREWSVETRRSFRASARGFFGWLHATGRAPINAAAELPRVKPAHPSPRPAPEIAYTHAQYRSDARTQLILRLAGEIGLRRGEIAKIHSDDCESDLEGMTLVVHGKGDRPRRVPLPSTIATEVRQGAAGHTEGAPATGWLFPGHCEGHLSPRYVGKLATTALPGVVTLHQLRHRFATLAYGHMRDTFAVQQLLGHASPVTTRRYVALPGENLRATITAVALQTQAQAPHRRAG